MGSSRLAVVRNAGTSGKLQARRRDPIPQQDGIAPGASKLKAALLSWKGSGREGMKKEMAMVPPNRLSASAASSGTEEDIQGLLEGGVRGALGRP